MTKLLKTAFFIIILQGSIFSAREASASITPNTKSVISMSNYGNNNLYVNASGKIKLIPGTPEYEDYMNKEHLNDTINSQRAWIYSTLVPGLGQIHNNQYIRAGVIWGTLLALGSGVCYCHNQYVKFYHENNSESFVKTYKKVRDSLLFVGLLCYIANIFDAYVGAELAKFDISDDVSVQIAPNIHKSDYSGASVGFSLGLSMK